MIYGEFAMCHIYTLEEITILMEEISARMVQEKVKYESSFDYIIHDTYIEEFQDDDYDNSDWLLLLDEFNYFQSLYFKMRETRQERALLSSAPVVTDKRKKDTGLYFVTISPPEDVNKQDFINATHRFASLKVVKSIDYVFEQRGLKEGEYTGLHTHMLVERNVKPYAFNKELKRLFGKFFPTEVFGQKQFFVENVENAEKKKVLRYMNGEKKPSPGKNKEKKVENDGFFRRDFGLKPIYHIGQME